MTEQERIEKAIADTKLVEDAKKDGMTRFFANETLSTIQAALEKQIPKKPDYEGDGYDDKGNIIYDTWICPNCGTRYEVDYDNYKHCPECGQAIDLAMEDEEDE